MAKVWKIHQFHIWFFILGTITLQATKGNLVSECNERCSSYVDAASTDTTSCDLSCRDSSCLAGCSSWDNSTLSECYTACNNTYSTEPFRVQYCQSGCLFAEDEFASAVKDQVGQPSAPQPSNIQSTSLTLTWTAASNPDVGYLVEWRYAEGGGRAWNYYGSTEPMSETSLDLTGLIPYAIYQFRVLWVITPRHILTSPQSNDVQTLQSGVPSTAPTITSIISSSPSSISLTWDPPPFPNGPITGYIIAVQSFLNQAAIARMVDGSTTQATVVDSSLRPSTLYAVSVMARNMEGIGPSDTLNVTTGAEANVTGIVPYLVVGVTSFDFYVLLEEASVVSFVEFDQLRGDQQNDIHTVDNENSTIRDVAVHYSKSLVFISDSDGRIHRRIVDTANLTRAPSEVLYTNENPAPSKLDVDWLNHQLFFVQGNEIYRCDIDVSDCEVAVTNIESVPVEMKVDPYIGYLFWSQTDSGIHRVPLSASAVDAATSERIINLSGSSAFTINSESLELFYSNSTGNSLHSASVDGSNQQTVRSVDSTDAHQFVNTTSIVYFNNTFTWTHVGEKGVATCRILSSYPYMQGEELYFENDQKQVSSSGLFQCVDGYHGLDVFYPTTQPIPTPAFPPSDLQVLFTENTADITWTRPVSVPGKGADAWEEWLYEVTITNLATGETTTQDSVQQVSVLADNLTLSTEYSVRVRAYSTGGFGPASDLFSGTTLIQVDVDPYLLLANETDIRSVQLDGKSEIMILSPQSAVQDIDWYQGYYIWSTVSGELYWSAEGSMMDDRLTIDPPSVSSSVDAIAVDWLSESIYWADTDQNQIIRGRLPSANQTSSVTSPFIVRPFAGYVNDLALDAVQAYVYWTTSSSVECSRLNGESPLVFYNTADLSLDMVAGLTLDLDGGYFYWFVVSRQNSQGELKLYRAQLAGTSPDPVSTVEEIGEVLSATASLALHFYSSKLFWINSESRVVVSDDRGQRQALLPANDVRSLTIIQESLKPLPDGYSQTPTVVAQEIPPSSIQVTGTWDDFNITWQASTEVTYGTVFYTVAVAAGSGQTYEETVENAYFNIQTLQPFQSLDITVRPYTYWATASQSATQLTSPMSVPSVPQNPRAFALDSTDIFMGTTAYSAEFRWSAPTDINGILQGYNVSWGSDVEQLTVISVGDSVVSYTFANLTGNTTYFFQVEGFTSVGSGPTTDTVSITTGVSLPPPTIVVSTSNDVSLTDTDTGQQTQLLGGKAVSVIAFVARDEKVFFIDATGEKEIYKSELDGTNMEDVVEFTGTSPSQSSFIIDWVSQILYWSNVDGIYRYDTTLPVDMATVETIYTPPPGGSVGGISISPHGSTLVWTETSQSSSVLMTSDLEGQNAAPLFDSSGNQRRRRQSSENCTCSDSLTPGSAVFIDSSDPAAPSLFFVDSAFNDLWISDLEGCQCRLLFEALSQGDSGLPPDALSVDASRVYWSNAAEGIVASVDKQTGADFQGQTGQADVSFVLTYGTSLQPYPDPECLAPSDYAQSTQLSASSSDSLTLTFDPVPECNGVSTATPVYTLYYGLVETDSTQLTCSNASLICSSMVTSLVEVPLTSLDPYSFYVTQVSVQNLYSVGTPVLGPVEIHQTTPGVPSPALNVNAMVRTPFEVGVTWSRPLEVNGPLEDLQFRVQYAADAGGSGQTSISDTVDDGEGQYSVVVDSLSAASMYTFTVESYQESVPGNPSSSDTQQGTTFQEPATVQSTAVSSTSLSVSWTAPDDGSAVYHWIQYREDSGEWQVALSGNTTSGVQYNVTIGEGDTAPLAPYTDHDVRAVVRYTSGLDYTYTGNEDILAVTTESAAPETPGVPTVAERETDPITYQVAWTAPRANGPGTLRYTLEARAQSTGEWSSVYEGIDTKWDIDNGLSGDTYSFRVSAANDDFAGPYSPTSAELFVPDPASDSTVFIIIGAVAGVLVIVAIIIVILVCRHNKKTDSSKWPQFQEDVELARLRNYPNTLVRQENSNYAVTHEGKEVLLPMFPRERLKLITFLGSGAFGEVFEGSALDILGNGSGEARVAVKTLRKGATDQEKQEFLKEATIMGKFKHPNIVSLMGVCLDNDPQYIILELMEGGDLLTYIRAARAPPPAKSKITLMDQIEMIHDVSKGCEYLEELHFVHRDLAARNCLVSTKSYDAHMRVVKIGDFGLARDIYKNDYYRKEGEGLLPVRWMSPEGLMDGYFSIQSDVWAFGVLMWEVISGGQQPYPARSNVEVLRFVEGGGRLMQPDKCPDEIYTLMRRCWEKLTEDRPSFKMLKEMIYDFRRKSGAPVGSDNFGFEGKINYSKLKDVPPEMEDYLLPMDSKGDIKKVPTELPPDIDYDAADKDFEEDLKKDKRKGSKKGRSPFSSLRSRKQAGAAGDATTPRLEAALQDLANNRDKGREVDDERYLKYPVGSVSKATGADMAPEPQSPQSPQGAVGGASAAFGDYDQLEGAVGYSAGVTANGDAPDRTELPNYAQPRKRHPNPFRANSMEELDGYDNLSFAASGTVSATDYTDV